MTSGIWRGSNGANLDKLAAEMEKKNRQNAIQPAGICEAEDTRDCAEASATITGQHSRRVVEEADPAGAPALWFDHRCRRPQTQRTLCLEGDEENRTRDKLPRTRSYSIHPRRDDGSPDSRGTLVCSRSRNRCQPARRVLTMRGSLPRRNRTTGAEISRAIANGRAGSPSNGACKAQSTPNISRG